MNASKRTESLKTWYNKVMTFFDNLKNKLFKEENGKRVKNDHSVGKSKDFQDKIKGLFAKKPDEVEQAVEDLDMSRENQETSRYQRSKQKKPIDTSKPLGKVQAFLSKFTLSPRNPIRRFWRRYHIGKILFILVAILVLTIGSYQCLRSSRCSEGNYGYL